MKYLLLLTFSFMASAETVVQSYGEGQIAKSGQKIVLRSSKNWPGVFAEREIFNGDKFEVVIHRNSGRTKRYFEIELKPKGQKDSEPIILPVLEAFVDKDGDSFSIRGDRMEPAQDFDISGTLITKQVNRTNSFAQAKCTHTPLAQPATWMGFNYTTYSCNGAEAKRTDNCPGWQTVNTETTFFQNNLTLEFQPRRSDKLPATIVTAPAVSEKSIETATACQSPVTVQAPIAKKASKTGSTTSMR